MISNTQANKTDSRILPQPDAELQAISHQLQALMLEQIDAAGRISFHDFMEMALYQPGLGYYSAGLRKFGAGGDFVTAPELGNLFARCLARPILQLGQALGSYQLLELGAGSGVLAADLLSALEAQPPQRYLILERSADLQQRQQALLQARCPQLLERVRWLQQPPPAFDGVILGNEVVDALPVERFRLSRQGIQQQIVRRGRQGLELGFEPAPAALAEAITDMLDTLPQSLSHDYQSEFNPTLPAWLQTVTEPLRQGMALLIDYGYPRSEYYHPQRNRGSLICHYRHRAHAEPLFWPGLQDITAFVDFTALALAGEACGLELMAYTSQSAFVRGCGLEQILGDMTAMDTRQRLALADQIKQLTLPGEMGERFQVMALGKSLAQLAPDLPGLAPPDLRQRL